MDEMILDSQHATIVPDYRRSRYWDDLARKGIVEWWNGFVVIPPGKTLILRRVAGGGGYGLPEPEETGDAFGWHPMSVVVEAVYACDDLPGTYIRPVPGYQHRYVASDDPTPRRRIET